MKILSIARDLSFLLPGLLLMSGEAWGIELAVEGKSDYVIVLADEAPAPVRTAARELNDHLAKVTGVSFPVITQSKTDNSQNKILVGPSRALKHLAPTINWPELGKDGIVIKTVGDNLLLAGGEPRGTVNAVFTFLEDHVGVRWWTPTESYLPRKPTLSVGPIDLAYTPQFEYREPYYRPVAGSNIRRSFFKSSHLYERGKTLHALFATRLKLNGIFNNNPKEYGGHWRLMPWCHSFYSFLHPGKYFKDHPEWYSFIEGKRVTEKAQLCLTNRAMRKAFIKNALERIRGYEPDTHVVSISQMDGLGPCQCGSCQLLARHEGSESGPIIDFVNEVAGAVEKEFPNVLVGTLAYAYAGEAPRHIKPSGNVVIRLCADRVNYGFPLISPENRVFAKRLRDWSAISPKLWIWSYAGLTGETLSPFPTTQNKAINYRALVANKVSGIFEQGPIHSDISDFLYLRTWLTAHLMWDPTCDQEALTREFLNGYYGPAGPYLYQYLKLVTSAATQGQACLWYNAGGDLTFINYEDWRRGKELYDQAEEAVADDPILTRRVQRNRLVFDWTYFKRYPWMKLQAKRRGLKFLGVPNPVSAFEAVITRVYKLSQAGFVESEGFRTEASRIKKRLGEDVALAPPPHILRHLTRDDWFDIQETEISARRWAAKVDDRHASNGKAVKLIDEFMPSLDKRITHGAWNVEHFFKVEPIQSLGPKLRCYAIVKYVMKGKCKKGPAFTVGIEDYVARQRRDKARTVKIQEIKDEKYYMYDLGVSTLEPGLKFYITGGRKTGEQVVYLDRIVLVRDQPDGDSVIGKLDGLPAYHGPPGTGAVRGTVNNLELDGWKLTFNDTFDRKELGADWEVLSGSFDISDGHLYGRGEVVINKDFPGDQRVEYVGWVAEDELACDLTAVLCSKSGRYIDGYFFGFGSEKNRVSKLLRASELRDMSGKPLIQPGKKHKVICQRLGKRIDWVIDELTVMDVEDSQPLRGSRVSFYLYSYGRIDDVKIYTRGRN